MDPTLTIAIVVICPQLAGLGALALQLRSHIRYQRQRHRTLVTLASRLPTDMLLELDGLDCDSNGLRLRTCGEQYRQEHHV